MRSTPSPTPTSLPRWEVSEALDALLPQLSAAEHDVVASLPAELRLDVPHRTQEREHWSGAAVVQMLLEHLGRPVDEQEVIVALAGWERVDGLAHESFSENLMVLLLTSYGLLPAQYYPAGHIAPKLGDGVVAADLIRSNIARIAPFDFELFKALLVVRRAPAVLRLHFSTEQYPMPEEVAERLDVAGHCVLLVGYDRDGFVVHDPWDRRRWGGTRGGAYQHISYQELIERFPVVNSSLDCVTAVDALQAHVPPTRIATYPGREVETEVVLRWPGLRSISCDRAAVGRIEVETRVGGGLRLLTPGSVELGDVELLPGEQLRVTGRLDTGARLGSFPVDVTVRGLAALPELGWVEHSKPVAAVVEAAAHNRVCVMAEEFFRRYGIREEPAP